MPVKDSCITVNELSFRYDKEWILKDISFDIQQGDYVGLIGPNGGGKTTLVKILLGLLKPTKGKVHCSCTNKGHLGHRVGYVPQLMAEGMRIFPATVQEVVSIHAFRKQKPDEETVAASLKRADVWKLRDQLIGELSGGQLQRVLIARALVGKPEILILDEPTLAIDMAGRNEFYQFLEELNDQGITIIMISHDIEAVAQQVKHVLCLNQTLICHGAPQDMVTDEGLQQLYGMKVKKVDHHRIHQH